MMHPAEDRMQDYIDDLLCREERLEVEEHLARCPACTARVRDERTLRQALQALPRSIEPPPHVLAGVNAVIDAATDARTIPMPVRTVRSPLPRLLAVAALLLVALVGVLTWSRRTASGPERMHATSGPVQLVRQVRAAEAQYAGAVADLERVLADPRARLTPPTRALLEQNLAVIDRALAESRAALAREPQNAALAELLHTAQRQKLELLRRAARATGGT